MEDELFLYRLFYRTYLDNPIHLVDGNFLHYKRNLILSYTLPEMAEFLQGASIKIDYNGEDIGVYVINSKYLLPGNQNSERYAQFFSYEGYCDDTTVKEKDLRLCLIADLKTTVSEIPSFRDYEFSFQALDDLQVEMCNRSQAYCCRNDTLDGSGKLLAEKFKFNKNHDFKTPLNIPLIKALPRISGKAIVRENALMLPIEDLNWKNATGMGVYSGGANGYRCLDIDGCDSNDFINSLTYNLGLDHDYPWIVKTGSGNGFHIWFMCDEDISSKLLLKGEAQRIFEEYGVLYYKPKSQYENTFRVIELRWNSFCMLPPSLGPNGNKYEFYRGLPKQRMEKLALSKLFETVNFAADNTSIKYDIIFHRDLHYGGFSLSEETETVFLCFDTETTGLPDDYDAPYTDIFNWPRIVQLSYVIFTIQDNDIKILKKNDFILAPDNSFAIPASSAKIHGISDATARKNGYNRRTILETFASQLNEVDYLVGHNVDFDINVLRAEFVREGIDDKRQFNHIKKLCTMKSAMQLYPSGSTWPKLDKLYYKITGKQMIGAHNSMNDVEATLTCFEKLLRAGFIEVKQTINYNSLESPSNLW